MELSCGRLMVVGVCYASALARGGAGAAVGLATTGMTVARRRSSPLDKLEADLQVYSTLKVAL